VGLSAPCRVIQRATCAELPIIVWERLLHSNRGLDVLIQPKQVGRVILVLQSDKTFVVTAISGLDPGSFLCVQVVDIDLTGRKRFDCRPDLAGPLDMMSGLPNVVPLRDDVIIPLVIAKRKAVSFRSTRLAAPWTWKNPISDIGDGIVAARSTRMPNTSSPRCSKKLDFQYRWTPPYGNAASSMVLSCTYDIGPIVSARGDPNLRTGATSRSPSAIDPDIPDDNCDHRAPSGEVIIAAKAVSSSGQERAYSR
jgi:hypothetical protein